MFLMFWRTSFRCIFVDTRVTCLDIGVGLSMVQVTNSRQFPPRILLLSDIVVYVIFFQQLFLIGLATSLEGVA